MKAKRITVARLKNVGNYEHERIEVELEVEDGETANDVLAKGRLFLQKAFGEIRVTPDQKAAAQQLLDFAAENETPLPF